MRRSYKQYCEIIRHNLRELTYTPDIRKGSQACARNGGREAVGGPDGQFAGVIGKLLAL